MTVTKNDIYKAIFKTVEYGLTDDFEEVLFNIVDRINDYSSEEDIYQAIDDELIYDDDRWTVMKHYQRPSEANFDGAMNDLTETVFAICEILKKNSVNESRKMAEDWNRTVGDALSQYQDEIYKTSSKSELKNLLTRIFDSTKLTPAERRYADKVLMDLDNKKSFDRAIMFVYDIILAGKNLRSPDANRRKFNRQ